MSKIIIEYWILFILGLISSSIVAMFNYLKSTKKRINSFINGMKTVLRQRLIQNYYEAAERGQISIMEKDITMRIYQEFLQIDNNDITVNDLMKLYQQLPVRDKEENNNGIIR